MTSVQQAIASLRENIATVIFGQEEIVTETMATLFTAGHILTTGAPGLAKTTLVKVFAEALGLEFQRIQFTPDLLPSDITGSEILTIDPETGRRTFEFAHGPVFTNLLLADEINRASPRTQSALLEAMQEKTVTVAGKKHKLPEPFMVFATQNPYESEGTFVLPEAQIDRFLCHALISYPDYQAEQRLYRSSTERVSTITPLGITTLQEIIAASNAIEIADPLLSAITDLVRATRPDDPSCPPEIAEIVSYGASPRAGLSLIALSKSFALIDGQQEVRWRHLVRMAKPALRHRLRLKTAHRDGLTNDADKVVDQLLTHLKQQHRRLVDG